MNKFKRNWIQLHVVQLKPTHSFNSIQYSYYSTYCKYHHSNSAKDKQAKQILNGLKGSENERTLSIKGVDENGEIHLLRAYSEPKYSDMDKINDLTKFIPYLTKHYKYLKFRFFSTSKGNQVITKALPCDKSLSEAKDSVEI